MTLACKFQDGSYFFLNMCNITFYTNIHAFIIDLNNTNPTDPHL